MVESSRTFNPAIFIRVSSVISFLIFATSLHLSEDLRYQSHPLAKIHSSVPHDATVLNTSSIANLSTNQSDVKGGLADQVKQIPKHVNPPPPLRCWRSDCPSPRRNHIFYRTLNKAGWNDRITIFRHLANLAGYLCANVYVSSPSLLLSPRHNNQEPVTADVKWSDFLHLTFGYNQTIHEINQSSFVGPDSKSIRLTSRSPEGNWEKFLRLENFTLAQSEEQQLSEEYFVWDIHSNVYEMDLFIKDDPRNKWQHRLKSFPLGIGKRRPDGCQYKSFHHSKYVARVVDEINLRYGLNALLYEGKNPNIGVLHLRRGDSKESCDTSPEKVKSFLECSFANTRDLGNFTLLLSTDEQDQAYISEILTILDGSGAMSHIQIKWLDGMVRNATLSLIQSGDVPQRLRNNFFVYAVSQHIWGKTRFGLIRRRNKECPECKSVRDVIGS
jgi:hypothetical protein